VKTTGKRSRFVEEYLLDLKASAAARRAGYSRATAHAQGHELLKKPEVAEAIAEAQAARSERTRITQDEVVARLVREADRTGDGASHSARVQALGLLAKHLGMFRDTVQHDVSSRLAALADRILDSAGTFTPGMADDRLREDEDEDDIARCR
jgi:hypothetical protein